MTVAGMVKLLHRYKHGDPHLWKREAFQMSQALLALLHGPGTPARDAQGGSN